MSSCPIWILASSNEIRRCIGVQTPDIPRSWGQISQSEVEFGETVRHMLAGHGRTTLELRNEEEDEGDEIVYPFSHPRPWDVDRALWRCFSFVKWDCVIWHLLRPGLTGQKPQSETCRLCTTGLWLGSYFFISHTAFDATCRSVWVVMKLAKVICKPRQSLVQSFSRPHHRPALAGVFKPDVSIGKKQ